MAGKRGSSPACRHWCMCWGALGVSIPFLRLVLHVCAHAAWHFISNVVSKECVQLQRWHATSRYISWHGAPCPHAPSCDVPCTCMAQHTYIRYSISVARRIVLHSTFIAGGRPRSGGCALRRCVSVARGRQSRRATPLGCEFHLSSSFRHQKNIGMRVPASGWECQQRLLCRRAAVGLMIGAECFLQWSGIQSDARVQ
jgi:hypothetical protein